MSPAILFSVVIAYFALLLGVAWLTSRNANNGVLWGRARSERIDTKFLFQKINRWHRRTSRQRHLLHNVEQDSLLENR